MTCAARWPPGQRQGRQEPTRQARSEGHDAERISDLFKGPTVVAYSADPVAAPKVAAEFAKTNEKFVILGGAMGPTL